MPHTGAGKPPHPMEQWLFKFTFHCHNIVTLAVTTSAGKRISVNDFAATVCDDDPTDDDGVDDDDDGVDDAKIEEEGARWSRRLVRAKLICS